MDIMDKVNELAKKVGAKANEVVEIARLNAKIYSENDEVDELRRRIGEICFGKYRCGDELDPEIENICVQIEKHKRNIAENQRAINRMKATQSDPIDMAAAGFCPYCGAELVKDAKFCPQCGKQSC